MVKEIRSASEIKKQNIASIKRVILEMGSVTKPEVAERTSLSVVTCGSILNELTADGTLIEENLRLSSGGRPAMSYRFSAKTGISLNLFTFKDDGHSFIKYRIRDITGDIKIEGSTQETIINTEVLVERILSFIKQESSIKILVVGIQGTIKNNIVEFSEFDELCGHNVAKELEEAIGIPTRVESDMNTIVLGYTKGNSNKSSKNTAVLFFPKGQIPAGGFMVDGHILHGTSNLAGAFSFYPFCDSGEDILNSFSNIRQATPYINKLIISTIAFLDPEVIVLSGIFSAQMDYQKILDVLQEKIHRPLPTIEIQPMLQEEYFTGLHSLAVNYLVDN